LRHCATILYCIYDGPSEFQAIRRSLAVRWDRDFTEWTRKLERAEKLQKIDEVENFLPLFLIEGAYDVNEDVAEGDK